MKTVFSALNGGLTLTEEGGKFTLSFSETLGGGQAAGLIKGSGSVELDAETGVKLGVAVINSHLPAAMLPVATVIEGVGLQALKALE